MIVADYSGLQSNEVARTTPFRELRMDVCCSRSEALLADTEKADLGWLGRRCTYHGVSRVEDEQRASVSSDPTVKCRDFHGQDLTASREV